MQKECHSRKRDNTPMVDAKGKSLQTITSTMWLKRTTSPKQEYEDAQVGAVANTATVKAKAQQHQLLIRHSSDLLQIEASYIHDGVDVNIILHIPMAQLIPSNVSSSSIPFHCPSPKPTS